MSESSHACVSPVGLATPRRSGHGTFGLELRERAACAGVQTIRWLSCEHNRKKGTVFTVGHSTLPIERFVALLTSYGIDCLADVRTVPRSRHNPQFNADALEASLGAAAIEYVPMPALGGLRRPDKNSINAGWRNTSFRGYADYMQTDAFRDALEALIGLSREKRVAIMCAEAVPWRCHRSR